MKNDQRIKLCILGSRGIPNQYGGFEEFAERLSLNLTGRGFDVWVYNAHNHPCRDARWHGVNRILCYDPEHLVGQAGQFIYDLNCIHDSRRRNFDIILQLGYTSSAVWHARMPKNAFVITNMDGLEWQRSKYSRPVQKFLRYAEKLAVRHSDLLIADNIAIRQYLYDTYGADAVYIPYGADIPDFPNEKQADEITLNLKAPGGQIRLQPHGFFLVIARMQPDNHIEEIIKGVLRANSKYPLVIVGNNSCRYGSHLKRKYGTQHIIFAGGIYEKSLLDKLRNSARQYFHGHSAGGTNPSLLEAMAASAYICAHNNPFNRQVLGDDALFFRDADELAAIIAADTRGHHKAPHPCIKNNLEKIRDHFSWEKVCSLYEEVFIKSLSR